jgi:hypothetical protein
MKKDKKAKQAKPKLQTVKVPGYWHTVSDAEWLKGKRPYYVKAYTYKRKSTKGIKRQPKPVDERAELGYESLKGYVLEKHYRYFEDNPDAKEEPPIRVVYTYKFEAIVEYQGKYLMSFTMDKDLRQQKAIEYYHSHFEPRIKEATIDAKEQILALQATNYVIDFISIGLYKVTGEGPITQRDWKLLRLFDNPEDVK